MFNLILQPTVSTDIRSFAVQPTQTIHFSEPPKPNACFRHWRTREDCGPSSISITCGFYSIMFMESSAASRSHRGGHHLKVSRVFSPLSLILCGTGAEMVAQTHKCTSKRARAVKVIYCVKFSVAVAALTQKNREE